MKQVINTNYKEYIHDIMKQFEDEYGTGKVNPDMFRQNYLDTICDNLRKGVLLSKKVYDEIPELHYWINKHFEKHGDIVVISNIENYEKIEIIAT